MGWRDRLSFETNADGTLSQGTIEGINRSKWLRPEGEATLVYALSTGMTLTW